VVAELFDWQEEGGVLVVFGFAFQVWVIAAVLKNQAQCPSPFLYIVGGSFFDVQVKEFCWGEVYSFYDFEPVEEAHEAY
jgi:hypothetical protein